MEEALTKLLDAVLSEYGAFVLFLLMAIVKLWMSKERAETRNNDLTDKLLDVVERNTASFVKLSSKFDLQEARRGGKDF